MPKIIARFSNGHEDLYKGKRDVKAAWMVVTPNGNIFSGHSQDAATAEKTARGRAGEVSGHGYPLMVGGKRWMTREALAYATAKAKEAGFSSYKAMEEDRLAKKAAFVASCKIEVVAL